MTRLLTFRRLLPGGLILGLTVLSGGCVSTTLELAPSHPARPDATSGLNSEPASLLRPGAALYQSGEAPVGEVLPNPDGTRANPYVGRGTIEEIRANSMVLRHETISGFMGAMTMSYPVAAEVNVEGLEAGDTVSFLIEFPESGGFQIFEIEPRDAGAGEGGDDAEDR